MGQFIGCPLSINAGEDVCAKWQTGVVAGQMKICELLNPVSLSVEMPNYLNLIWVISEPLHPPV